VAEKEKIFSSNISSKGIFSFQDSYKFCYDWLTEETGVDILESKYSETLKGNLKDIDIEWVGTRKVTDYFKFEIKVVFKITDLTEVEVEQGGAKIKTNKGKIKITVTGTLVRDYDGKFEKDAFRKFLRSIYEKWVIQSRIDQFEDKLFEDCDEFLSQTKAYLALEGKR